jgi:cyclophilin family peptidyl-prolyl cis-trans isomerase
MSDENCRVKPQEGKHFFFKDERGSAIMVWMRRFIVGVCGFLLAIILNANASPPTVLTEPQSVTINDASSATFTVVATNALTYQWLFEGSDIANATNATLVLEDVTADQAGYYTVIVSSSDESVISEPPAQLTLVPGTIVRFIFSGLLTGQTNYVDVQLFNYDKPVTVQNFLQYVTSGAYSNMFFDRCLPGFVLQGGGCGASNTTDLNSPIYGWDIPDLVQFGDFEPPFATSITNEFYVGPLIHNDFGTIAMAKASGEVDSAANAFFFNLADNSANLDAQDSGFTVFGRILDCTNALQYFNALTDTNGIVDNDAFLDNGTLITNAFPDLPVNYVGTSLPANGNLVFCDFQISNPNTSPPTLAITSPAPGVTVSNGSSITVTGTASDGLGLAWVRAEMIPVPQADGSMANAGYSSTNYIVATTNWSITLDDLDGIFGVFPPGQYLMEVEVQDEDGNITQQSEPLTVGLPTPPAQIVSSALSGTNLLFTVASYTSQYYIIWSSPDLGATDWTPLSFFAGNGSPLQVSLPVANNVTEQYFSVQAVNF